MLEVKKLSKIYKPKNGAAVKALDDVSLTFAETGMVFLLGKSGSGKSTLLNVCGGLDAPTSGEIIVKGRSSKSFSQGDFDSYRNTFIGFIFQEYNILNEFTVEDNIALALELQNKPKDKAAIEKLLSDVDLSGYAKRKPNTLSGGQKQRIAIARALIKNPEIIMADEPSGALDSATGKQVFETLKKLSKDKLVIVVSHDRDFAEQYGDRIIELKDGKVISDVSKHQEKQIAVTENIGVMGNVLCVKQGAHLDENDFAQIKSFLSNADTDILIASGEKEVKDFKKVSRISDDGGREVFKSTAQTQSRSYRPEDSKFIRSKLPLRHAMKIGLSGLRTKPVRLFFTILLCTVAFVMFGLVSTMSFYNSEGTFKQSLMDSDQTMVSVSKEYLSEIKWYENGELQHTYTTQFPGAFTQKEIEEFKKTYGEDSFGTVTTYLDYGIYASASKYWVNRIEKIGYITQENSLYHSIQGAYPENDNELCISSYMADLLVNCQAYDEKGEKTEFQKPEDVIGHTLRLRDNNYKITGIFDSGEISPKFDSIKSNDGTVDNPNLVYSLQLALSDGLHLTVFGTENAVSRFAVMDGDYGYRNIYYRRLVSAMHYNGEYQMPEYANAEYLGFSEVMPGTDIQFLNPEQTAIGDGEILINRAYFFDTLACIYDDIWSNAKTDEMYEEYMLLSNICRELSMGGTWNYDAENKEDAFVPFTDEQKSQKLSIILAALKQEEQILRMTIQLFDESTTTAYGDKIDLNVVGFYELEEDQGYSSYLYISDALKDTLWNEQKGRLEYYEEYSSKYVKEADAIYSDVFLPYDHSQQQTDLYWEIYSNEEYDEDDSGIRMTGSFASNLKMVDSYVKDMSKIFLYIGLVLAVFAALLFSNFISVSISQKKRDIGILRAVGAKSADVFKIFFSESAFIALICIVISTIGCIVACDYINASLSENLGASLFVFGIWSFGLMVAIALLTAILATFLPAYSAARKKPIESIRSI